MKKVWSVLARLPLFTRIVTSALASAICSHPYVTDGEWFMCGREVPDPQTEWG